MLVLDSSDHIDFTKRAFLHLPKCRQLKETISAMDGRRSFADAQKQREEIVRALTESKSPVSNEEVWHKSPAVRVTGKLALSKLLFPGCRKCLTLSTFNTNPHRSLPNAYCGDRA